MKKIITLILVTLLLVSLAAAWTYSSNVKPHTRYNPLRYGCYYYYGYGSCQVENEHCRGVTIGKNKWIDLGDACKRNKAPSIIGLKDITVTETDVVKITANCLDEDPVITTITGWTTQTETLTNYNDAGKYEVTITCTDSFEETTSASITIIIKDKNRAPLFRAIGWVIE